MYENNNNRYCKSQSRKQDIPQTGIYFVAP